MLKNAILIVKYDEEEELVGFIEANGYDVEVINTYEELESREVEAVERLIEKKLQLEDVFEK